jgi:hypothetical protein
MVCFGLILAVADFAQGLGNRPLQLRGICRQSGLEEGECDERPVSGYFRVDLAPQIPGPAGNRLLDGNPPFAVGLRVIGCATVNRNG